MSPKNWKSMEMVDPTEQSNFASGALWSRALTTADVPLILKGYVDLITTADKNLIRAHRKAVGYGGGVFTFQNPEDGEDWDVRYRKGPEFTIRRSNGPLYRCSLEFYGIVGDKMKQDFIDLGDLAAGADITDRYIFCVPYAVTIDSIQILHTGSAVGIDDSNTAVILIEDDSDNTIVSKTYDTANQPPTNGNEDLGSLSNASLLADEAVKLSITQGATANLGYSYLIINYYKTN
jgi:hypothetical protein